MKKIFLILTTISILAGMGCKKGYLDVNTNPNQSTSADPSLVLPAALAVTVGNWYPGPTGLSEWMNSWAVSGSYAINGNDPGYTYKMTTDYGDGLWQSVYDNLEDYQYIIDKSNANAQPFLEGVGRIMKSYNMQYLVDLWNDVPYADALRGASSLRPVYSKGMDVYDSCFIDIQRGIDLINSAGTTVGGTSDIMFGGDKTLWVQFANTVRLRMLLRMSQLSTPPDFFQTAKAAIVAEPAGFLTEDALVQPGYVNSTGQGNPFWQRFYNLSGQPVSSFGDFWAANDYAVNFYKGNNDPRLSREFSPVPGTSNFVGTKLGLANGNPVNGKYSVFGPGILIGPTAPAVMMLASESYFLQAEAAVLGYISDDAAALYEQGVTSSFEYLGVPGADAAAMTYYSQSGNTDVNFATATTVLAKQAIILRQKWAALNSINSFSAYADYRKFDYLHTGNFPYPGPLGDNPLSVSPYIDVAKIPTRYLYPTSEYSRNPDNVGAEGTIDQQVNKIWWMQ
ncbi:MAG TPA: SusD/RagB family nutrient-binding outer membrane lipoprotein [Ginsengibacter sp.]